MFVTSSYAATTGSYALYDYNSAGYVVRYNHTEVRSIASITKLFTAITVLNSSVDLNEKIYIDGIILYLNLVNFQRNALQLPLQDFQIQHY